MLRRTGFTKKKVKTDEFAGWQRKIIHIDMDAFFAAIEQRNRPELKGKPVIIGGSPQSRGVVSTASYEARKFGVRSAMPSYQAYKKCPEAVFIRPDIDCYREVSAQIMKIFRQHTAMVEPVSLDEAYLDVTAHKLGLKDPRMIAKMIKDGISAKTQLTASAGVAPNMFLAKVASDCNKPDGLTVIHMDQAENFLAPLPVRIIPGIGPVGERKLSEIGIRTCADLSGMDRKQASDLFGKNGVKLIEKSRGIDERQVEPNSDRKQISSEITFERDLKSVQQLTEAVHQLCTEAFEDVLAKGVHPRTLTLKVKYGDFSLISRSSTPDTPVASAEEWRSIALRLLENKTEAGSRPVRLIGVGFSNFLDTSKHKPQDDLFELK